MARKVSKGKKPTETMRQRQQRLLKEQKARKAAASKPVKYKPSKPASQSVQKVKVKVEGQKQLPGGKPQKALPPGKKGGPVSSTRGPRRTNVNTNPSGGNRVGQPGPNRGPTPNQLREATRRAGTQVRRPGVGGGLVAPLTAGATIAGLMEEHLPRKATPSNRGSGRATDRVTPGPSNRDARRQAEANKPKPQGRNWSKPHGQKSDKPSSGDHTSARKPKPTATKPATPAIPAATKPAKPARTPQSKDMDANYKAWAKANSGLAKKVKKGQTGFDAIQKASGKGGSTSTGNHRGAGNGAPGAQTRTTNTPNKDSIKPKKRTWLDDNYKPNKKKK